MPRTKGAANKDSQQRKLEILSRIWTKMRFGGGKPISWREMAVAGKVGLATLSHHFGKRDDVIVAILEAKRIEGEEPLRILAEPTEGFEASIEQAIGHLSVGLEDYDVGDLLSLGFSEGINHDRIGPAFVKDGLEPIVQAAINRLRAHQERGEMRSDIDLRAAAIMLVSPLIIAYTHQTSLGGKQSHPIEMDKLKQQIRDAFVRAYSTANAQVEKI